MTTPVKMKKNPALVGGADKLDSLTASIRAFHQHYRHEIGHLRILSNLPPAARDFLSHACDRLNASLDSSGVHLTPEDLCLLAAFAQIAPLSYLAATRTHLFQRVAEVYFAFWIPTIATYHHLERGHDVRAAYLIPVWVLMSLVTVLERASAFRSYGTWWYLAIKCGLCHAFFSERYLGSEVLFHLLVRPHVMPFFGLSDVEGLRARKELEEGGMNDETAAAVAPSKVKAAKAAAEAEKTSGGDGGNNNNVDDDSEDSGFSFVDVDDTGRKVTVKVVDIAATGWEVAEAREPYLVLDVVEGVAAG
eukprot:CAMPEP_0183296570 /NCGR_PEP_ID=MMETSP0160_2-20130417/4063_1 /TAXON_ID=2839 ORGANISM="Odontella Sinensis, Strain Grunow 1884" /NCGR_SAMPLE_ID=MMETSP0160_2 /ASSEMBLY_ACC=CAM_ASM_000250 /LENGTH=304 /DNA_ID=CAMNT_0025458193 /DNA_START=323 /DNA_END=1233 /DNA_ORIENTATION=-